MKIAYKLVRRGPYGMLTSCISCIACQNDSWVGEYFVYYTGQIMRPPYGKFFVFGELPTEDQIYKIIGSTLYYRVYKCVVPELLPTPAISGRLSVRNLKAFWKEKKYNQEPAPNDDLSGAFVISPIPGTFWASEIILIEDVTPQIVTHPK